MCQTIFGIVKIGLAGQLCLGRTPDGLRWTTTSCWCIWRSELRFHVTSMTAEEKSRNLIHSAGTSRPWLADGATGWSRRSDSWRDQGCQQESSGLGLLTHCAKRQERPVAGCCLPSGHARSAVVRASYNNRPPSLCKAVMCWKIGIFKSMVEVQAFSQYL
jgi:hypothetical protein